MLCRTTHSMNTKTFKHPLEGQQELNMLAKCCFCGTNKKSRGRTPGDAWQVVVTTGQPGLKPPYSTTTGGDLGTDPLHMHFSMAYHNFMNTFPNHGNPTIYAHHSCVTARKRMKTTDTQAAAALLAMHSSQTLLGAHDTLPPPHPTSTLKHDLITAPHLHIANSEDSTAILMHAGLGDLNSCTVMVTDMDKSVQCEHTIALAPQHLGKGIVIAASNSTAAIPTVMAVICPGSFTPEMAEECRSLATTIWEEQHPTFSGARRGSTCTGKRTSMDDMVYLGYRLPRNNACILGR